MTRLPIVRRPAWGAIFMDKLSFMFDAKRFAAEFLAARDDSGFSGSGPEHERRVVIAPVPLDAAPVEIVCPSLPLRRG